MSAPHPLQLFENSVKKYMETQYSAQIRTILPARTYSQTDFEFEGWWN